VQKLPAGAAVFLHHNGTESNICPDYCPLAVETVLSSKNVYWDRHLCRLEIDFSEDLHLVECEAVIG